ncbi:DUF6615 family protein [Pseudidiomarina aestuarii]|uniref:DUF6615 family protein n=1 Tax=Pseudidiomarina aestuarii TaxID=624146 RepID=UPI003A97ECE5
MINCYHFRAATAYVAGWISAQSSVGEESITDWLLYDLSAKVSGLKYLKFTKPQEARVTGADWEWWFIGNQQSLRLRIQAKRLRLGIDAYPSLAYSNQHGLQIDKLLDDARANNALAFYVIYVEPGHYAQLCGGPVPHEPLNQAIYLAAANTINRRFISPARRHVSVDDVVEHSNPIECLVCCPYTFQTAKKSIDELDQFVNRYFRDSRVDGNSDIVEERRGLYEELPGYVSSLVDHSKDGRFEWYEREFSDQLPDADGIVTLDLRSVE